LHSIDSMLCNPGSRTTSGNYGESRNMTEMPRDDSW
jgi:hypothetical protein